MKKQPEITDLTRESLVTAFFQLAEIKPINQITIREITNRAGYNRTTFYRYFEDVYALIEYAEDEFIKGTVSAINAEAGNLIIGDRRFFEIIITRFHENKSRVSILMSEQNRSHFLRRIREKVPTTQSGDSSKIRIVKDIYFYGIMHAIMISLQNRSELSDDDLLDIIQNLFNNWYWKELNNAECKMQNAKCRNIVKCYTPKFLT